MKIFKNKEGLSLVEVTLALTIATVGVITLLSAAAKAVAIAGKSKEYEIVRSLLSELDRKEPLQLDDLDEDVDGGSFERPYNNYRWRREVKHIGVEEDEIFEVTTEVIWASRKNKLRERMVTYLHLPTAKQGGYIDDSATND